MVSKLEAMTLSEEQALEEGATLLRTIKEVLAPIDSIFDKDNTLGEMVIRKLSEMKVFDYGEDYVIKLSTILEKTEVLLTQHNQMEWLTSKPAVKLLEDKELPNEKKELALQMDSYVGTKYERLKKFLHIQRTSLKDSRP